MSKNRNAVELHGCIVCTRLFNILAVYAPNGSLVGCTVTASGGHIVPDKNQPLLAILTQQRILSLPIKDDSPRLAKSQSMKKKRTEKAPNGL